jgi:hypothetical protein
MSSSTLSFGRLLSGRPTQKQDVTYVKRKYMSINGCILTTGQYAEERAIKCMEKALA